MQSVSTETEHFNGTARAKWEEMDGTEYLTLSIPPTPRSGRRQVSTARNPLGYTRPTMVWTTGCNAVRRSQSLKPCPSSNRGLKLVLVKPESLVSGRHQSPPFRKVRRTFGASYDLKSRATQKKKIRSLQRHIFIINEKLGCGIAR